MDNASAVQRHWAIVELSAGCQGGNGSNNIATMFWKWLSTTSGHAFWKMQALCGDSNLWSINQPAILANMLSRTLSRFAQNQRQWCVNHFRPCILENQGAMQLHWSMIELSAASLGKNVLWKDRYLVPKGSSRERQRSVDRASTELQRYPILHLG